MFNVDFEARCRVCLGSDGARHIYSIMKEELQEVYKNKTEFEVMNLIEKWRLEGNKKCLICGVSNVEVLDVKIEDYPLYDFDYLADRDVKNNEQMLIFRIDKTGTAINIKTGGTIQRIDKYFMKSAVLKTWDLVNSRPNDDFLFQNNGTFFICITGRYNYENNEYIIRVERYRNTGLTRKEILDAIKPHEFLVM